MKEEKNKSEMKEEKSKSEMKEEKSKRLLFVCQRDVALGPMVG